MIKARLRGLWLKFNYMKERLPRRVEGARRLLRGDGDETLEMVEGKTLTWREMLGTNEEDYMVFDCPRKGLPAVEHLIQEFPKRTEFLDIFKLRQSQGHDLYQHNNPQRRAIGFVDI